MVNYRYGEDSLGNFYGVDFIRVNEINNIINKCDFFIWTITDINQNQVEIIKKIKVKKMFIVLNLLGPINKNSSQEIHYNLLVDKLKKNGINICNLYLIKENNDWSLVRSQIDKILLGFDNFSDNIYLWFLFYLFLLYFILCFMNAGFNT